MRHLNLEAKTHTLTRIIPQTPSVLRPWGHTTGLEKMREYSFVHAASFFEYCASFWRYSSEQDGHKSLPLQSLHFSGRTDKQNE